SNTDRKKRRCVTAVSGSGAFILLLGIGRHGLSYPSALFVGTHPCTQALPVTRAIAFQHFVEFVPVDFSELVVAGLVIPLQIWVGNGQAKIFGLRHSLI